MSMDGILYNYRATILRVIDADTLELNIDIGFTIRIRHRVRLLRINAPEIRTPEGKAARDFVMQYTGWPCWIKTEKSDSFGRYLAEVFLDYHDGSFVNLNNLLLEKGLAIPYT